MVITNRLSFCVEPDVAKYFETHLENIETEYRKQLNNSKKHPIEIIINDTSTIDFLVTIDYINELNLVNFHDINKLKTDKFNLLKDWYFLNKDKLSIDIINEARSLSQLLINDYLFIYADTTTFEVRHNRFLKRLKRRNIDRGILSEFQ